MDSLPSLAIDSVTLHNFKSYAGTHKIGPFNRSFTAVVGPNGNGKSNILDALLFVFGFKAKSLRQSKLADLIHKSANYPDFTSAYVQIDFCIGVEGQEGNVETFSVKRTISSDSKSQYFYNDYLKTQKEVISMLKHYNLDLTNNRFLILQGEVENISLMKPKADKPDEVGLLEYLEEVIGTNKYIPEIEELKKLKETSEFEFLVTKKNYQSAVNMLDGYKEPFEEAVKLLKLKLELTILNNLSWQGRKLEAEANIHDAKQVYAEKEQELRELRSALNSMVSALPLLEGSVRNASMKVREAMRGKEVASQRVITKTNDRNHAFNTLQSINESITRLNEEHTKYENLVAENTIKLSALSKLEQTAATDIPILNRLLAAETEKINSLNAQFGQLLEPIIAERSKIENEMGPLQDSKFETESSIQKVEASINNLNSVIISMNDEILKARSIQAMIDNIKNSQQQEAQINSILEAASNELELYSKAEHEKSKELALISKKLGYLRASADEQKNESKAISALKSISGVHGRLGDLGQINSELLPAFVAAAGGILEFVVVDTVAIAERCIKILKDQNSGICSFLILEKVSRNSGYAFNNYNNRGACNKCDVNSSRDVVNRIASENHFLIDLISFNKDLFAAWHFALRETKLSTNLTTASSLNGKVVTLRGEIVDPSGAMTGGGNIQALLKRSGGIKTEKNRVKFTDDTEEMSILSSKVSQLEQTLSSIRTSKSQLVNQIEQCNANKSQLIAQRNELLSNVDQSRSVQSIEAELVSKNAELNNLSKELKELAAQLQSIDSSLIEYTKKLEDNSIEFDKHGGKKIRLAQREIDSLNLKINTINNKLKNSKNEETRLQSLISLNNEKLESCRAKIVELEATRNSTNRLISEIENSMHDLNVAIEEAENLHIISKNELGEAEAKLSDQKQEIKKSEEALKSSSKSLEDCTKTIAYNQRAYNESLKELAVFADEFNYIRSLNINDELDMPTITLSDLTINVTEILTEHTPSDYSLFESSALSNKISFILKQIEKLGSSVDMTSVVAYKEKKIVCDNLRGDFDAANEKNSKIVDELQKIEKTRTEEFKLGFDFINRELQKIYRMLTISGTAELSLFDFMNPFSEGISFSVYPPKKSWRLIQNLSGGEKTIASLALIFALHNYRENPIYIMDEIDAALDFRNVSIVANYVLEKTKNSQFIVISLRNNMFELAQTLVGVYKSEGCTHSICVDVAEVARTALESRTQ